jgi:hypothetical protein
MSKNYNKVLNYYNKKLWSKQKVFNAVGKWITAEEYQTIVGEPYSAE